MSEAEDEPVSIPVVMLSGFLGAGKTTSLKYFLENSEKKIACLVNDVASINIDSKLIRDSTTKDSKDGANNSKSAITDMVELQNGCACCSAADELFPSFAELLKLGEKREEPFDIIVLENSGVAEPQNIRDSFLQARMQGHPICEKIHLFQLITIVDASNFRTHFASRAPLALKPELGEGGSGSYRPVVDLLVEQIECCDLIVLNKTDLISLSELESLIPIMTSLNPLATVITCTHGKIPLEYLERGGVCAMMNVESQHASIIAAAREQEDFEKANSHSHHSDHDHHHEHEHKHEHEHDHKHDHNHDHEKEGDGSSSSLGRISAAKKFGITSFIYSRRRPFHPQRLRQLILKWIPSYAKNEGEIVTATKAEASPIRRVLRSKGFVWLASSHTSTFYWSHAGQHLELQEEGEWWVCVPESDLPQNPNHKSSIYKDFDAEGGFGDRRQEIVFIGSAMDKERIVADLDELLLTDEEMEKYKENWSICPDPPHPEYLNYANRNTNTLSAN